MKRSCPTIQELLALDAVARHRSLTQASTELCVTVSAVSKQIAALEAFLGVRVLRKEGRGVELTSDGRVYWQKTASGLRAIETATYEARSSSSGSGVITLASVPTFLTKWLIPRLPDFSRMWPGITLSFSQHLGPAESIPAGVDAAIRYGSGDWPAMTSEYVAGREFVLVSSRMRSIRSPADIAACAVLHHDQAPTAWRQWGERYAVADSALMAGPRFAQYSALIQAAVSGLGIGLVPKILVEEELRQGSLVQPIDAPVNVHQGHYLCFRPDRRDWPPFAAFRSWLLAQADQPAPCVEAAAGRRPPAP